MKTKRLNALRLIQETKDGFICPVSGVLPFTALVKACARCGDLHRACRVLAENIAHYGDFEVFETESEILLASFLLKEYCI